MPLDRSRIHKGMFIRSDEPLPGYTPKRRVEMMCNDADGYDPEITEQRLAELAEERKALAARMDDLKARISAAMGKRP